MTAEAASQLPPQPTWVKARIRRGTIWTPTATGTTCRARATSGRLTRQRARPSIPTATGTGCGLRAMATSGCRDTRGAICRSSAERGTSTTISDGDGRRGLGGCSPWWGLGFYGGPRFGALPPGYRVIPRPILPHRPVGGRPIAMIAVNHTPVIAGSPLPARNRNTPVTIGGSTVVALRPLPSRPVFVHAPSTTSRNQPQPENQGTIPNDRPATPSRPGYNVNRPVPQEPTEPNRPSYGSTPPRLQSKSRLTGTRRRKTTVPNSSRPSPSSSAPANHPSSGGSSGGGSPHPSGGSSGGGGGGGSHPSRGGGGGGGGGGSHGGGGGGGGGSSSGHH